MPNRSRINVAVSTVYDSLSANAIDCVQFVVAVEEGLSAFPGFIVGQFETEDHFFVHLGFDEIDDEFRAVSVVVGFHSIEGHEIDYFLRQYTGHFIASQEEAPAGILVEAVYEEITKRVDAGWLEP